MAPNSKMITMGCGVEAEAVCPASFTETEDWALEDPERASPLSRSEGYGTRQEERTVKLPGELW